MYASCAKATAAHINAMPAAMRIRVLRRVNARTRSVPVAVVGLLLYFMLRRYAGTIGREPTITNGYRVFSQRSSLSSALRSAKLLPSLRTDASVAANRWRNR